MLSRRQLLGYGGCDSHPTKRRQGWYRGDPVEAVLLEATGALGTMTAAAGRFAEVATVAGVGGRTFGEVASLRTGGASPRRRQYPMLHVPAVVERTHSTLLVALVTRRPSPMNGQSRRRTRS